MQEEHGKCRRAKKRWQTEEGERSPRSYCLSGKGGTRFFGCGDCASFGSEYIKYQSGYNTPRRKHGVTNHNTLMCFNYELCILRTNVPKVSSGKQVFILVFAIVAGIAFIESSGPIWTLIFLREFLLKLLIYGAVSEFIVVALGEWIEE